VAWLGLCALCSPSSALDVSDANYVVEPYATYSQPGLEIPNHMAFDGSVNLYVTHTYSSNMWLIRPNGKAREFLTSFQPTGVEWGGGTLLGDYLYVVKGTLRFDCLPLRLIRAVRHAWRPIKSSASRMCRNTTYFGAPRTCPDA